MRKSNTAGHPIRSVRILAGLCLCLAVLLIGAGGARRAQASEVFANLKENLDTSKRGSITLTIADPTTGTGMSGISLELIRVASIIQDGDGNYHYTYTEDFQNSATDLSTLSESDMGAREAAALMQTQADSAGIRGTIIVTNAEGRVSYTDLDLGVYLIRNYPVSENSESIRPFLVTVPRLLNNEYVYDVDATGKPEAPDIGGSTDPSTGTDDTSGSQDDLEGSKGSQSGSGSSGSSGSGSGSGSGSSGSSSGGSGGSASGGSKLPQTGQLWWPVPVLAAAGLILILIGIARRRSGKKP